MKAVLCAGRVPAFARWHWSALLCGGLLCAPSQFLAAEPEAATSAAASANAGKDEAVATLKAVEEARQKVLHGTLTLKIRYRSGSDERRSRYFVSFLKERVRFDQIEPGPDLTIGVFDGRTVISFDGERSVTLDSPQGDSKTADSLYDPRMLGISPTYKISRTLRKCLAYEDARSVAMVGPEKLGDIDVVHIHIVDAYGQGVDFWVDREHGFRVMKSAFHNGGNTYQTSVSTYKEGDVLPSEVVQTWTDANGEPREEEQA